MTDLATSLVDPIREGSFPASAELLSSDLDTNSIPQLIEAIRTERDSLSNDLKAVSKPYAGGVDQWIAQAKQVQQDIARCKQEARDIVQEYERVEQLRRDTVDAESKLRLLHDEIAFQQDLQSQLHTIATANGHLRDVEGQLQLDQAVDAARGLAELEPTIRQLRGPRARAVVAEYRDHLLQRTTRHLTEQIRAHITVTQDNSELALTVETGTNPSDELLFPALSELDAAGPVIEHVVGAVERVLLEPLSPKSSIRLVSHSVQSGKFVFRLSDSQKPSVHSVLKLSSDLVDFLCTYLPHALYEAVAQQCGPRLVASLVGEWLTPAIPVSLDDLSDLDSLREEILALARFLDEKHWPDTKNLKQWTLHAPRMWIGIRKGEALDAVRRAFAQSSGDLHQVERVERQKASKVEKPSNDGSQDGQDDWNASWEDDKQEQKPPSDQAEDDASGWGFDDGMEDDSAQTKANGDAKEAATVDDDVDEAWGWNEDSAESPSKGQEQKQDRDKQTANGDHHMAESQELEMKELYSVTDIPDRLLESIGRDIQDAVRLQQEQHASLKDVPASSGLLTLPSLSLSMFRATASIYYSKHASLGNMNLYNDALYIADKLQNMPRPAAMHGIDVDCKAMERFGRSAYAKEMDLQRTILTDLLDGVQGFTIPYAEQIEEAISATSDRLRQVHREWSPILSTSALLQSIGALYSSIISKVITDIEEMDDISEAQSQRLSNFCSQLSKLEDLFIANPPGDAAADQEPMHMVAVYSSNWLRFQYLDQLLSASLVDIKYLWTEGELSLEFSAEEVVDLIMALFAESTHRRSAIAVIRGNRGSGMSQRAI
ncbi:Centromere/kinetochore-like protein [Cyphellophora attinorum]|uniref:Centromere/kinetochore-like protein n=1 Tax=Cyphellophora attinorum TaxID=1664694 RepID=A0A0N1HC88_9EURO|nr:Centromere/kinetochore-like protein [Phialophora attinorum]KPI46006.1 Centromere/kinetochore-like protein [Phialophora attinorum]